MKIREDQISPGFIEAHKKCYVSNGNIIREQNDIVREPLPIFCPKTGRPCLISCVHIGAASCTMSSNHILPEYRKELDPRDAETIQREIDEYGEDDGLYTIYGVTHIGNRRLVATCAHTIYLNLGDESAEMPMSLL